MDGVARDSAHGAVDGQARLTAKLLAVAQRDRAAFEALYAATVDRVLTLVGRIVGDPDTADDVASEVYLQVWREAERFDPERGSAIAWIMMISRSRALDTMRRRSVVAANQVVLQSKAPDPADEEDTAQDLLFATDRESAVHRALAELDSSERQLLALAYFRGYSHSELAQVTGQPLGTVKTQIRRTLKKLKLLMLDESSDTGETA